MVLTALTTTSVLCSPSRLHAAGPMCVCAPPGTRRHGGRKVLRLRGGRQDASPEPAHRKQSAHSAAAEPDRDASARTGGAGGRRDDAQCGAYRGKWSQKCKASFLVLSADRSTVYNPHYTERHDVIFEAWSVRADTPIPSQGKHYFEVRMWQDDKARFSSSHVTRLYCSSHATSLSSVLDTPADTGSDVARRQARGSGSRHAGGGLEHSWSCGGGRNGHEWLVVEGQAARAYVGRP